MASEDPSLPQRRRVQGFAARCSATLSLLLVGITMLSAACAPNAPAGTKQEPAAPPSVGSRLLRVGILSADEPKDFGLAFGSISAGASEPRFMLHAPLTVYDEAGVLTPRLVERIATVENGDWRILPDGKMEVVWKLRPNVLWHDGAPLVAGDVVLGYRVASDPKFALATSVLRQIEDVTAPDPHTVVVRWRNLFISANEMGLNTIVPIPRHRLGDLYESSDESFAASPFWNEQWVGLGPFKMTSWERGSHIEAAANEDYFLGRPRVDRVVIRYFGDTRALIVGTLAGDVDLVPVGSMKTEEAAVLKTQWEAAGNGNVTLSYNKLGNGWFQFRDPVAPWVDPQVRQAMTLLVDRQNMVETLHNGLSDVDDIFFRREASAYKLAQEKGLPDLKFDVNRAHRLLAQAGLARGPDGAYRSAPGAPFRLELSPASDINSDVQTMFVVSNAWKQAGIESDHVLITPTTDRNALRSQLKGVALNSTTQGVDSFNALVTGEISSEGTRWRGTNTGGYSNPVYDDMHKRVFTTINASEREQVTADLIKFSLDNALYLPLTYSPDVSANRNVLAGVTSVVPTQRVNAWNAHLWQLG